MLTVHHLTKHYDLKTLFTAVSFSVLPGERVGLIGPNGAGKSTLLRLLAGIEAADNGRVQFIPPDLRVAYLPQGLTAPGSPFDPTETVGAVLARFTGNLAALEHTLVQVGQALADAPADPALQAAYDRALTALSAVPDPRRAAQVVRDLGLDAFDPDLPLGALSGGQQTRLMLAQVILSQPDVLLLDEPTNHLDATLLDWLEDWLAAFPGAALIVSHDRAFLDNIVNRVLDLDPETQQVRAYVGNYSDYVEQVLAERDAQWDAYRHQQAEIRRMHDDIVRTRNQSLQVEHSTTPRSPNVRRIAKKVMKKAKSREKKLARYLESDERVEKPKAGWQLKLDFTPPESGQQVLVLTDLSVGYSADAPLLHSLNLTVRAGERVALAGANGSGKTTLLRTLTGDLPPLSGALRFGPSIRVGYLSQDQTALSADDTPVSVIQAVAPLDETETRSFLHFYLFSGDEALKPL